MLLADVAVPLPLAHALTYEVPERLAGRVSVGMRVVCPLQTRRAVGVVLDVRDGEPPGNVRPIAAVADTEPAVPAPLLAFLRELASYYFAPIGEVLRLALPPLEREVDEQLREPSLFDRARGVASRKVQWVAPLPETSPSESRLGGQAAAILASVQASGAVPVAELERRWKSARAAVKRLVELGVLRAEQRERPRDRFFADVVPRDVPPDATAPQLEAHRAIGEALASGEPRTFLLDGVTGSGKTEVYLRCIGDARARGRGSLVLVPEIALTPQLVGRFRARFGDDVAVIHSALTPRERLDTWRRLRDGALDVAIGARSALFAPIDHLGLVIVDEEHDGSFKQEDGVRYHARDMAILRAHRAGGVCVLGTATRSLETEQLVRQERATRLVLPHRARAQPLPRVEIIDLRRTGAGPTGDRRVSLPLHRALEATLAAREQAILFLNRRGFAPSLRCEACGELAVCPSCSVALTVHKRDEVLRCHYCDHERPVPKRCGKCDAEALALEGLGTERLEETIAAGFPGARVARLDRDVASGRAVERVIARVRAREIDVLVGTQMVTKGHDLPHVTLVGVINADAALSLPDFRATERAFQLLVQVAGRAGRGDLPGRVLVQTYDPEHPAIVFASRHDVGGFVEQELRDRAELGYPPFARAALVRVEAIGEEQAKEACAELARIARASAVPGVDVLGPAPAPLARLRNRFRFRVFLRAKNRPPLRRTLAAIERAITRLPRDVHAVIDVDPVQLL